MDIVVLQGRLHLLHRARRPGGCAARALRPAGGRRVAAVRPCDPGNDRPRRSGAGAVHAGRRSRCFATSSRPARCIATVDAVHGVEQLARYPECRKQVAVADRLVITKSDIADPAERRAADRRAGAAQSGGGHSRRPRLGRAGAAARSARPSWAMRSCSRLGSDAPRCRRPSTRRRVAALAFTLDEPIEWSPFSVWLSLLLHAHGENVLRFKALLDVAGWSGPVVLDGIHHLIHPPIHLPAWPDGPRAVAHRDDRPRHSDAAHRDLAARLSGEACGETEQSAVATWSGPGPAMRRSAILARQSPFLTGTAFGYGICLEPRR